MPVDELERVRRADPVPNPPDAPPIEQLRERLDAEDTAPAPARARHRRAARLVIAAAAIVAIAAGVLVASPTGQPDVLAAVYRNTSPGPGTLHMRWQTRRYEAGTLTSSSRVTVWDQPRLGRTLTLTRNVDDTTGRVTEAQLATVGARSRSWSSRRPGVIRAFSERTGQLAAWDGGIGLMRLLYRNGTLELTGRTSDGRWKLSGTAGTGTRLTVLVTADTFVPSEIRQESDLDHGRGTAVTITRYSIYRRQKDGPELGLDLPGHRGLPVVPLRTPR